MPDKKPPRNEHELEIALVRLMRGDNGKMLSMRSMMANAIVGQFLPDGAILKGGGSLRFRYGSSFTRNTKDFDATRHGDLDGFLKSLRSSLHDGWDSLYDENRRGLNVLDSVDGAIEFVNELIRKIDES